MVRAQLAQSEDELVRKLGSAVADKWGVIPPYAQDQIIDQVCERDADATGFATREALTSFLERYLPKKSPLE